MGWGRKRHAYGVRSKESRESLLRDTTSPPHGVASNLTVLPGFLVVNRNLVVCRLIMRATFTIIVKASLALGRSLVTPSRFYSSCTMVILTVWAGSPLAVGWASLATLNGLAPPLMTGERRWLGVGRRPFGGAAIGSVC